MNLAVASIEACFAEVVGLGRTHSVAEVLESTSVSSRKVVEFADIVASIEPQFQEGW